MAGNITLDDVTKVNHDTYKQITGTDLGTDKRGLDLFPRDASKEIVKGNVEGQSFTTIFGHNPEVGTTEETVWPEGGLYTWPASAAQLTVSSSSANDVAGGSGLTMVLIIGLDADYAEIQEFIMLNGQTGVTTVNSYLRVNQMVGITAGSTGYNEGAVYIGSGVITNGKPASIVNMIEVGANLNATGFFTIPAGKTGLAEQAFYDGQASKELVMNSYTRSFGGLFLRIASFNLSSSVANLLGITSPGTFTEKSDIEFRGIIDTQTGDLKIAITFLLIDN